MDSMTSRRTCLAGLLCLLLSLPSAAEARAKGPTSIAPPGNSALDQYSEVVPTSGGNTAAGGGPSGGTGGSALPAHQADALAAQGSAGRQLRRFAGATAPKASRGTAGGHKASPAGGDRKALAAPSNGSVASGIGRALAGTDSGGGMGALLPILLALTAAGGIAYVGLRKRHSA